MSKLILQSIMGIAFLMVCLALALFLSAGSLAFRQAWVYLAVFFICTLLITLYLARYDQKLLASRVSGGPTAEVRRSQQIIQGLAGLSFVALYVVAGLDFRFRWSSVPSLVSLLGEAFVILGFFIVFRTFQENSYGGATIGVADEQTVVESGPYAWLRHPMYAGAFLLLLFTPIALGSWVAIPFVLPLIAVVVARLLDEEKFLSANLPGYEEYRRKVRYRLIPFVW
jgi:protein-S-isoprenylcysteine O-methyltransferase Ste14